jgi:hypothetical protein
MLGDNTRTKVTTSTTSGGPQKLGGIRINDVAAVEAALKEIGNEKGSVNWILLEYQGDGAVGLIKKGQGQGIPPQQIQNDIDDNKVQYMVLTFTQGVRQYGLFTWVGPKAPAAVVSASNQHKAALHQQLAVRQPGQSSIPATEYYNLMLYTFFFQLAGAFHEAPPHATPKRRASLLNYLLLHVEFRHDALFYVL